MDSKDEVKLYPCTECGKLRTKDEGGTTFTVCDECWDKSHKLAPTPDRLLTDEEIQEAITQNYAGISDATVVSQR